MSGHYVCRYAIKNFNPNTPNCYDGNDTVRPTGPWVVGVAAVNENAFSVSQAKLYSSKDEANLDLWHVERVFRWWINESYASKDEKLRKVMNLTSEAMPIFKVVSIIIQDQ